MTTITVSHGIDTAREMAIWLHGNVKPCNRSDMVPEYASFLNDTVQWAADDRSWVLTCKPRQGIIKLNVSTDSNTEALIKLKWA